MQREKISACLKWSGKAAFVRKLPVGAILLDVGCGNDSPRKIKGLRPDLHYIGVDVQDYNINSASKTLMDQYVLASPDAFHTAIKGVGLVDAVISAHNIEHCNNPKLVLDAMVDVLCPHGRLYLSTPCEESVRFPHRRNTLNFYDDATHRMVVPARELQEALSSRMKIVRFHRRYRPPFLALIGLITEPASALVRRNLLGTWALYGFETVIWAEKL